MHERTFGQFARVLIDIDLLQPLRYNLLVERKGFAFFVDLEYEHIPEFCTECKMISHRIENCHRWMKEEELRKTKENIARQKAPMKKQVFVPVSDERVQPDTHKETLNVATEIIHVEETSGKSPQHIVVSPNDNDGGNSQRQQEEITSQQRNLVAGPILEPASPRSFMREQDKQLENALNNEDDDWSTDSQDSIVKDTQLVQAEAWGRKIMKRKG
jgi:hypothetical protein